MLKKHMAACLMATLFVAPAFAQTSGAGSTAAQPGTTNPPATSTAPAMKSTAPSMNSTGATSSSMNSSSSNAGSSTTMAQAGANSGEFVTKIQPNQMMASDLIGTKVIGANNESIGDINDVIVDRNGQAVAAVIGVGGFLGIGEKNVAVPFNSLKFASRAQVNAMNNAHNGNAAGSTAMNNAGMNAPANGAAATNGNVNATGSVTAPAGASANAANDEPERVILSMTKDQLKAAPKFDKNANNTATGSAAPNK